MTEQNNNDKPQGLLDILRNTDELSTVLAALGNDFSIANLQGIDDKQIESLYALAYEQYEAGNYDNAKSLFNTLLLLDPSQVRFFMGQAACLQASKQYEQAIASYSRAFAVSMFKNPEALYNSAMCFLKLGQRQEALDLLSDIDTFTDQENERHRIFADRCKQLLLLLKATTKNK